MTVLYSNVGTRDGIASGNEFSLTVSTPDGTAYALVTQVTAMFCELNDLPYGPGTVQCSLKLEAGGWSDAVQQSLTFDAAEEIVVFPFTSVAAEIDAFNRISVSLGTPGDFPFPYYTIYKGLVSSIVYIEIQGEWVGDDSLPNKATTPSPADSSSPGVDFSSWTLSWVDGGGATSFNVYLGDSPATLNLMTTTNNSTYTIPDGSGFKNYLFYRPAYWRVDAINDNGTTTGDVWTFDPRPAKVTNPSPVDAAENQRLNVASISWDASAIADTYDVYFTGYLAPVSVAQEGVTCNVPGIPLEYDHTYYWRVDAVNEFGTTTGDVWSFTTLTLDPPQCIIRYRSDGSLVPAGTAYNATTMYYTGENFMGLNRRLVGAAGSAIWYEETTA